MLGVTVTLSVVHDAADAELDGFRLGYVAEDGTQHQLPLEQASKGRLFGEKYQFLKRTEKGDHPQPPSTELLRPHESAAAAAS